MHVHASDSKLTEGGSAKFFVKSNGDSVVQNRGILKDHEITKISDFIKDHIFVGRSIVTKVTMRDSCSYKL